MKYFILLPSVSDVGTPYDDIQWAAVLKSVSGFEMYRKRYGRIAPERIVEFLLLDGEFPRAVRYCIGRRRRSRCTPSPARRRAASPARRSSASGVLRSELDYAQVEPILPAGLHEFLRRAADENEYNR